MNNLIVINALTVVLLVFSIPKSNAQVSLDSSTTKKEYTNLEEALENPDKVFRLNLSNQNIRLPLDSIWAKFQNLEYLSLRNDHLTKIPEGIGSLKNLRVLDLSGNDFKLLPESFSRLENLNEIYLDDEKKMDINKSLWIIKDLPNLKKLHLENDNLKSIPSSVFYFHNLEALYLNNNRFKKIPKEIQSLKNIKYIDLHDNKFKLDNQNFQNHGFGIKIRF